MTAWPFAFWTVFANGGEGHFTANAQPILRDELDDLVADLYQRLQAVPRHHVTTTITRPIVVPMRLNTEPA